MRETTVLAPIVWRAVGDMIGADDNDNILLASVRIGAASMQMLALEVTTRDPHQDVVDKSCSGLLDIIYQVSGEGDALESFTIGEREYVLIMTPRLRKDDRA